MFKTLKSYINKGYPIGTDSGDIDESDSKINIVKSHAYSLLEVEEIDIPRNIDETAEENNGN